MGNEQSTINEPHAKYQSGDRIATQDGKKGYIRRIQTKYDKQTGVAIEFWYGVEMDKKIPNGNGHDGQGAFSCKPGHGAVIPESFIKLKLNPNNNKRSHNHNNCNNHSNSHNNNNNNYGYGKEKQLIQIQDDLQQRIFLNTQDLLDQTNDQLKLIQDYIQSLLNQKNSKEISNNKQKVKIGLRLYHMFVSSLYDEQKKNKLENYNNAFKQANVLIHNFEESVDNNTNNINHKLKKEILTKLKPVTNYMYSCLVGVDDDEIPELPVQLNYEFNEKVVTKICSAYIQGINHTVPQRTKEIKANKNKYKKEQNELLKQSKNIKKKKLNKINVNEIVMDIQGDLGYTPSAKQVRDQFEKERKQFIHQEPDEDTLINGKYGY